MITQLSLLNVGDVFTFFKDQLAFYEYQDLKHTTLRYLETNDTTVLSVEEKTRETVTCKLLYGKARYRFRFKNIKPPGKSVELDGNCDCLLKTKDHTETLSVIAVNETKQKSRTTPIPVPDYVPAPEKTKNSIVL